MVDLYKGKVDEEKHLGKYLTYLTYFSTVVSGPIERNDDFKKELSLERKFDYYEAVSGLLMIFWGMF
ncbi:MAG: hypothetical protein GX275_07020 [Clostridiales bacterium]|nr:hypothetical protein [Clostridiales bacterium]